MSQPCYQLSYLSGRYRLLGVVGRYSRPNPVQQDIDFGLHFVDQDPEPRILEKGSREKSVIRSVDGPRYSRNAETSAENKLTGCSEAKSDF